MKQRGALAMLVEMWLITKIQPYANNPRLNDSAVDAVAASIREFGFRQPIVVDEQGIIVVGHTRYKAALKLGLPTVPVHVAVGLTPEQIKAYRIADNQSAELSDWNYDLLPIELAELQGMNYDLGLLGFDPDELAGYLTLVSRMACAIPTRCRPRPTRRSPTRAIFGSSASTACCAAMPAVPRTWTACSPVRPFTW
jgi:ParB-like chromosome segregation protein Spo0J